jgi:cation transport ATPase
MISKPELPLRLNATLAQQTFQADFACVSCAESAEHALRLHGGIADAQVEYAGRKIHVSYDPALIDAPTIEDLVGRSAYDCRCAGQDVEAHGGGLLSLAHKADMAAITEGTTADRMQYEFPSTHAGKQHQDEAHAGRPALRRS